MAWPPAGVTPPQTAMARNIEIKARIDSVEGLAGPVRALADGPPVELFQDDTFFSCATGRLKLRVCNGEGELIGYERPDAPGPRESRYVRCAAPRPEELRQVLARTLGVRGRVVKRRLLFLRGQTRIHLDRVEGLGDFLELEVVLREDQTAREGTAVAEDIFARLGLAPASRVAVAYRDLLEQAGRDAAS